MSRQSAISGSEASYVDSLYQDYQRNPDSIDEGWKRFFEGFDFALKSNGAHVEISADIIQEFKVFKLIEAYRTRGHLVSQTNPIRPRKNRYPHLSLEDFGLSEEDLKEEFLIGKEIGLENETLESIIEKLKRIYTGPIGVEYMFIRNQEIREWVKQKYEEADGDFDCPLEQKKRILSKLNEAVVLESFLDKKYVGQKRFSLEGGENTITALDAIVNKSAENGVEEIVIGMAHRGRLNVLANILGKTYEYIFSEFEGNMEPDLTMGDGDVKYHLGFSSKVNTAAGKKMFLKLIPNPSHLEAVNPVVEGYTRAKSDVLYDEDEDRILPILIHGDAAIAGQGVAYEVVQMSKLDGYYTGGTIHFVINNQIGFTTDYDDARSSDYCTGAAKVIDAPVLHVNGDDAEAVAFAAEFAVEFRQKFNSDIFIDMLCYRRHGHNEGDDPKITQPNLYRLIGHHKDPREVYSEELIQRGDIHKKLASEMKKAFNKLLQDRLNMVKEKPLPHTYQRPDKEWRNLRKAMPDDFDESPDTSVPKENIEKVIRALIKIPEGFHPIKQVQKLLEHRQQALKEGNFDWALGELCAYGTLLLDGKDVRLSGQDTVRGTFSHRHAVLFDEENSAHYNSLNHIAEKQGKFRVYNSLLSEYAALGFEYGYSLGGPNYLTLWEAQFGDFANGAQTVIDQFITSGASKWQKMTGLVLLLPHGYEGQGAEHSNGRPERFLQLAAEYNMYVVNCTTPANFFHALRRQLALEFRKPLIVFTPKSLLRSPKVMSEMKDFTDSKFQEIIDDSSVTDPKKIKRVLFCSGKIFYDLQEKKEKDNRKDIAIVRLEQIYPLLEKRMEQMFKKYNKAEYVWVQEEPKNMGAWTYLCRWEEIPVKLFRISRKSSASPATGYHNIHQREQQDIINKAFDLSVKSNFQDA